MMQRVVLLVLFAAAAAPAHAGPAKCKATLKKWASFPSFTLAVPPSDAPSDVAVSGKFAGPGNKRTNAVGANGFQCSSVNKARCTDTAMPIPLQPVQGLSGVETIRKDGSPSDEFYMLTDNGFGNKVNSPDAMLMFHKIKANFTSKKATVASTTFLSDPDKKLPFPIQMEGTAKRYLTGSDLDTESMQHIKDSVFIGDEFGPYLVEFDATTGKALAFYAIDFNGTIVKSPDHMGLQLANPGASPANYTLKRSRGFEGMAASPDKKYLYPMLEGPLYDVVGKFYENVTNPDTGNKTDVLRIWKFNVETKQFEGNGTMKYMLEMADNAIGDFNVIDGQYAMVAERDNNEGDPSQACIGGNLTAACYEAPAAFKRIYLIDMANLDKDGFVKKLAYVDLMDIEDPEGLTPYTVKGKVNFPVQCVEDVDVYDAKSNTIITSNDNNFPYSSSRKAGKADDNELLILEVPGFFNGGKC